MTTHKTVEEEILEKYRNAFKTGLYELDEQGKISFNKDSYQSYEDFIRKSLDYYRTTIREKMKAKKRDRDHSRLPPDMKARVADYQNGFDDGIDDCIKALEE